jgi:hypothetical protein
MLSYSSNFGKILMGEHFKILFTMMNNSSTFPLTDIKIKVIVSRTKAPQSIKGNGDVVLYEDRISLLNTR